MWPWQKEEAALDAETVNGLIRILLRIEAKLEDVLALLQEDPDGEEEEEAGE